MAYLTRKKAAKAQAILTDIAKAVAYLERDDIKLCRAKADAHSLPGDYVRGPLSDAYQEHCMTTDQRMEAPVALTIVHKFESGELCTLKRAMVSLQRFIDSAE